jgi:tRNA pseudouridine55 synthase
MNSFEQYPDQIFAVNKPVGISSYKVISKLKKEHNLKKLKIKIGHAGTLDPLASGILVIATGKKTKEISNLQIQDKEYIAEFVFGGTTPTLDSETEPEEYFDTSYLVKTFIQNQIDQHFIGDIWQKPPIFSAIMINGKRAYSVARNQSETAETRKEFEQKILPKSINVLQFDIIEFRQDVLNHIEKNQFFNNKIPKLTTTIKCRIICSKGTYIRSLVRDLAECLNTVGYMSSLIRTRVGEFKLSDLSIV